MKKGIVLVANLKSQSDCENLVFSIRQSGCRLPIRLIHFGGEPVNSPKLLAEVEFLTSDDFPEEAKAFIRNLRSVLTDCPVGFLYRFLAWFSDWDAFIYSDNDIVALMNWDLLFDFIEDNDMLHADEEYTTLGIFNYLLPHRIEIIFGEGSLNSAVTAGHIVVKRSTKMIADMNAAVDWFKQNPAIPQKHDQALLHIAKLIGNWKVRNLCRPPFNWLSSWCGDYKNSLALVQAVQGAEEQKTVSYLKWIASFDDNHKRTKEIKERTRTGPTMISHLHYSGRGRLGPRAIDDFSFSSQSDKARMMQLMKIQIADLFFVTYFSDQLKRIKRYVKRKKWVQ